jgi:chromosome segregation ATPase
VDQLFERLTTLSARLKSAVEVSSSLQAQHTAAQSTISALESRLDSLETLERTSSQAQDRSSSLFVQAFIEPTPLGI